MQSWQVSLYQVQARGAKFLCLPIMRIGLLEQGQLGEARERRPPEGEALQVQGVRVQHHAQHGSVHAQQAAQDEERGSRRRREGKGEEGT